MVVVPLRQNPPHLRLLPMPCVVIYEDSHSRLYVFSRAMRVPSLMTGRDLGLSLFTPGTRIKEWSPATTLPLILHGVAALACFGLVLGRWDGTGWVLRGGFMLPRQLRGTRTYLYIHTYAVMQRAPWGAHSALRGLTQMPCSSRSAPQRVSTKRTVMSNIELGPSVHSLDRTINQPSSCDRCYR